MSVIALKRPPPGTSGPGLCRSERLSRPQGSAYSNCSTYRRQRTTTSGPFLSLNQHVIVSFFGESLSVRPIYLCAGLTQLTELQGNEAAAFLPPISRIVTPSRLGQNKLAPALSMKPEWAAAYINWLPPPSSTPSQDPNHPLLNASGSTSP